MRRKKKQKEKTAKNGQLVSSYKAEAEDYNLKLAPDQSIVNTLELAKDILVAFHKYAQLPSEGRANVQNTFGDLLHKNLINGTLKAASETWQQMGIEISMFALSTVSVTTEVEVVRQAIRLDDHQPGAPLPPPLAIVQGTDKAQ